MSIASRITSIEEHIENAYNKLEDLGVNLYKLPEGYTQLDYIESTGTQYIDTGYIPVQGDNFEFKNVTSNVSENLGTLFSAGTEDYQLVFLINESGKTSFYKYFATGAAQSFITPTINKSNIKIVNGGLYIDGTLKSTSTYAGTVNTTLYLGRRANTASPLNGSFGEVIITNGGTIKRDLIPCKNSSNVIGMYDLVTKTFLTNSGTGTFTAGETSRETIDKNIDNIATKLEQVYEEYPKVTASDVTEASLNNTKAGRMGIGLKGNTSQNGTPTPTSPIPIQNVSGNNTIKVQNKNEFDKNNPNILNTAISATGTGSSSPSTYRTVYVACKPNTTYIVSKTKDATKNRFAVAYCTSTPDYNMALDGVITDQTKNELTITTGANANYLLAYVWISGGTETANDMVNSVQIHIAGGEQNLPVNLKSKNLFDGELELGIINGSTGANQANSNYIRSKNFIEVKELSNYKFSTDDTNIVSIYVYEYKEDFTYNLTTNKTVQLSSYLMTNSGTKYIKFRPNYQTTDTSIKFQIEEGITATTYEPYWSYELSKIGTAQDYFYKENDKWYIHKEIGNETLSSDKNWSRVTLTTGERDYYITENLPHQNSTGNDIMSNYFKGINYATYYSTGGIDGISYQWYNNSSRINLFFETAFADINDFKSWLNSHSVYAYYELATPTNTEITETSLINELEAIRRTKGYNEQTTVSQTNSDLPFILDLSALQLV